MHIEKPQSFWERDATGAFWPSALCLQSRTGGGAFAASGTGGLASVQNFIQIFMIVLNYNSKTKSDFH